MISVVCVFNNLELLEKRLLNSLRRQSAPHEVIVVDNRDSRFPGAAAALNYGASQTKGDWLLFAHQDVELLADDWLVRAEQMLEGLDRPGWIGVAGMTKNGVMRSFLIDRACLIGEPFEGVIEVQTLDEVLLIHRRKSENESYFDDGLRSWHSYGVEACCRAIQEGEKNYIIPLPIWHDSESTNIHGIPEAHNFVWAKYGRTLARIHTTCGTLPDVFGRGWGRHSLIMKLRDRVLSQFFNACGFEISHVNYLGQVLEQVTDSIPVVDVIHAKANHHPLQARSFIPHPKMVRTIVHHFSGVNYESLRSDYTVVMPDAAASIVDDIDAFDRLRRDAHSLLLCFRLSDILSRPRLWRLLGGKSSRRLFNLSLNHREVWDEMAQAVALIGLERS